MPSLSTIYFIAALVAVLLQQASPGSADEIQLEAWSVAGPVEMFYPDNANSLGGWSAVVKRTLLEFGCDENTVVSSLAAIFKLASNADGRQRLNQIFVIDDRSLIQTAPDAVWLAEYAQSVTPVSHSSRSLQA